MFVVGRLANKYGKLDLMIQKGERVCTIERMSNKFKLKFSRWECGGRSETDGEV